MFKITEKVYHNPEWKKFLESLNDEKEQAIAGKVMTWVKNTYPQFTKTLNGGEK